MFAYACMCVYISTCENISTCGDDCVCMCVFQPMRMCMCLFLPMRMHVYVKIWEDAREQTTLGVVPYVLSTIFWSLGFSLTWNSPSGLFMSLHKI